MTPCTLWLTLHSILLPNVGQHSVWRCNISTLSDEYSLVYLKIVKVETSANHAPRDCSDIWSSGLKNKMYANSFSSILYLNQLQWWHTKRKSIYCTFLVFVFLKAFVRSFSSFSSSLASDSSALCCSDLQVCYIFFHHWTYIVGRK